MLDTWASLRVGDVVLGSGSVLLVFARSVVDASGESGHWSIDLMDDGKLHNTRCDASSTQKLGYTIIRGESPP